MKTQCVDEGTLRAYLDGELAPTERESVEDHLGECVDCRVVLDEQQRLRMQVGGLLGSYLQVGADDVEVALGHANAVLAAERDSKRASAGIGLSEAVLPAPTIEMHRDGAVLRPRRNVRARVGLGLGLGLAAALVIAFWLVGLLGQQADGGFAGLNAADYVPQGKVRHLVYTYLDEQVTSEGEVLAPDEAREDVWFANGKDHLLMYRELSSFPDYWLLVNDDGAYTFNPYASVPMQGPQGRGTMQGPAVYRTDFDSRYLLLYVPDKDKITEKLKLPNAKASEGGEINGRDTLLVEVRGNMSGLFKVTPSGGDSLVVRINEPLGFVNGPLFGKWGSVVGYNSDGTPQPKPVETPVAKVGYILPKIWFPEVDYRMWFDKETNQLLQQQYVTHNRGDGAAGEVLTRTIRLVQVDIIEQSAARADLFALKTPSEMGVVDASVVFGNLLLPSEEYVAPESNTLSPSWFQSIWAQGGFSLLRLRDAWEKQNNGEWHRTGNIEGDLQYIAGYKDHVEVIPGDKLDGWLDGQMPEFVATMDGTVQSAYPVPIDGGVGRELLVNRKDGKVTKARVYVVGQRMYFLYATAPDMASLEDEHITEYLGSFEIVTPPDKLPVVGNPAPAFELPDLRTGASVRLSGLRGQPVVLSFSTTWCLSAQCKEGVIELGKLYAKHKDSAVFLSILSTVGETPDSLREYASENHYDWTILSDIMSPYFTDTVAPDYSVNAFPTVFFIDREGVIRDIALGTKVVEERLEEGLAKIR